MHVAHQGHVINKTCVFCILDKKSHDGTLDIKTRCNEKLQVATFDSAFTHPGGTTRPPKQARSQRGKINVISPNCLVRPLGSQKLVERYPAR